MQNNGGQQPQGDMSFYYMPQYTQGADGMQAMNPGQNQVAPFDAQQVQGFAPAGQDFYNQQDPNMNNMSGVNNVPMGQIQPAMLPAWGQDPFSGPGQGMVPQQMMVITPMMQPQPQQQQQQQPPMQQQPQQNKARTQAFKIVDPKTREEVGAHGEGGVPGASPSSGGCGGGDVGGGMPNQMRQQQQQQQQQMPQQQQVQQAPMMWQPQGFMPGNAMVGRGPDVMGHGGPMSQQQQPQPQQQQQGPPQQMQQNAPAQGAGGGPMRGDEAPAAAAPAPAPAPAPTKKKMMNKKIEKVDKSKEAPAAAAEPAAAEAAPTPAEEKPVADKDADKQAAEKAPNAEDKDASKEGGASAKALSERQKAAEVVRNVPTFAANHLGTPGQSNTNFASSIKALNLEPMRSSVPPISKRSTAAGAYAQGGDLKFARVGAAKKAAGPPEKEKLKSGDEKSEEKPKAASAAETSQSAPAPQAPEPAPAKSRPEPAPAPVPQPAPQPAPLPQAPAQQQHQDPQQQAPQMSGQQQPMQPMDQQQQQQQQQMPMQPQQMQPQQMQGMQMQPGQMMPQGMQPQQMANQQMLQQQLMQQQMLQQQLMQQQMMQQQHMQGMSMNSTMPGAGQSSQAAQGPLAPAPTKTKKKLQNVSLNKLKEKAEEDAAQEASGGAAAANSAQTPQQDAIAAVATPSRGMMRPENGVFDRTLLLRIFRCSKKDVHPAVQGLRTRTRVDATSSQAKAPDKSKKPAAKPRESVLKPSEGGYQVTEAKNRTEKLEREVRSLLNKICPDNLRTIVERLALIELYNAEELEFVIRIIFGKALNEPHYCETYADMVFALRTRYPEFPAENENEKPITFTRVLLNTCQNEFEGLPAATFEPTEEEKLKQDCNLVMKKRKDRMLANMKFIGNLFLRQLLAVKVVGTVVHDLIGIRDGGGLPEEHMIECVCELLQAIGHTLDGTNNGKMLMHSFASRLQELKGVKDANGQKYSKRVQFLVQDLLELRQNHWQKKLFKEQAKAKDEIRRDAMKDQKTKGNEMFATQVAGMRPAYMDDLKAAKGRTAQSAKADGPQKIAWDQAYVKKCFQYFAEEKNGPGLHKDWVKATPTSEQSKKGIEWLCDIGLNDMQKEDSVAETIVELIKRQAVTWQNVADAVQPFLDNLEDMKIDVPKCDIFFHSLFSKLLLGAAERSLTYNPVILKQVPLGSRGQGSELAWNLFHGALRKVKRIGGKDALEKALNATEVKSILSKAKGCSERELNWALQDLR